MKSGPRKFELTADVLLRAYSIGVFPMAESREASELFWVEPQQRGVFPLDGLIVSKSLAKTVRSDRFHIVADRDFRAVMRACAERDKTWINDEILRLYCDAARRRPRPFGRGLPGRRSGRRTLRSQPCAALSSARACSIAPATPPRSALVHLVARLRAGGFRLLDTQFLTEHLASLGAIGVSRDEFRRLLARIAEDFGRFLRVSGRAGFVGRGGFGARPRHGSCE